MVNRCVTWIQWKLLELLAYLLYPESTKEWKRNQ
jgi:hypothetical protein